MPSHYRPPRPGMLLKPGESGAEADDWFEVNLPPDLGGLEGEGGGVNTGPMKPPPPGEWWEDHSDEVRTGMPPPPPGEGPGGWQMFDESSPDVDAPSVPSPSGAPAAGPTFEDFERDYWAPDRREVLVRKLERDYWAPDREAALTRYREMPDAELWPHGKPGATDGTTTGGGTGGSGDYAEFGRLWLASGGRTVDDLKKFIEAHPGFGATIFGSKGDKVKIGSRSFDAVIATGEGGRGGSWYDITDGGDGGGGGGGGGDGDGGGEGTTPSALAPWTKPFRYPSYEPPKPFQAPTGEEVFQDPGFQFRLGEGEQGIERAASARGGLNTGGTLKALMRFGQGLARQEYGNVYNRRLGEYQQQGGLERGDWARDYDKAMGEYGLGREIFYANQDRPWNKLSSLAGLGSQNMNYLGQLGQGYGGLFGQTAGQMASGMGDWWTQGANAQAAGQVGGANAWNQALGNIPWWMLLMKPGGTKPAGT